MKLIVLLSIMNLLSDCSKNIIWKDDELSTKRTDYAGNQLKTNGYYFLKKDKYYYDIYVFNNNGVILAAGGLELSETEMDKYLTKEFVNSDSYKKYKSNWGVFEIDGMLIKFERWYPSDPPLKSYINSGLILNDSTFQITKSMRSDGSEVKEINEIYHFRSFSPKPDSTNSFVR